MPDARDITRALSRVQAVLRSKNQAGTASRDIRLGLERISRAIPEIQKWNGVHVGGTNGKGSICAFLSGLFTLAGVSYGRYVSPAFPHPRQGVTINGRTVNFDLYHREKGHVKRHYEKIMRGWRFATSEPPGDLSPFELETATAFQVFNETNVKYGIVEVGMGGATDATNVMTRKAVTVISKIDLDHQEYLGNQLQDIAKVKAGIMRPGIPCIVDHTNTNLVMNVLREHAKGIGAPLIPTWRGEPLLSTLDNDRWQLEDYQKQNLLCAALAFRHIFPYKTIDLDRLMETEPYLPGRMEWVDVSKLTDDSYRAPVLVDAAHNMLGVQSLAKHVDSTMRSSGEPVTWVMGLSSSKTKPFDEMIETLVRPHDNVAFVEYEQGENEPQATPATLGRDIVRTKVATEDQVYDGQPQIQDAIQWAVSKAASGPVIVTGSLYLIRDFFNLKGIHRFRQRRNRLSGSSELWRLNQLERHQRLTQQELEQLERERSYWQPSKEDTASENSEPASGEESASSVQERDNESDTIGQRNSQSKVIKDPQEVSESAVGLDVQEERDSGSESHNGRHNIVADPEITDKEREELNKLHHTIYYHNAQSRGYRSALTSSKADTKDLLKREDSLTEDEAQVLSRLQDNAPFLQQQADKHHELAKQSEAEYHLIRNRLRARRSSPAQTSPGLPRVGKSPFFVPTELDPPKKKKAAAEQQAKRPDAESADQQKETDSRREEMEEEDETDFWGRKIDSNTKL